MKKIIIVISLLAVITFMFLGCARRPWTPEMQRISSVLDTSNCKFIQHMYFEVEPDELIYWITSSVYDAGGDAYKIVTAADERRFLKRQSTKVNFEIYKCK